MRNLIIFLKKNISEFRYRKLRVAYLEIKFDCVIFLGKIKRFFFQPEIPINENGCVYLHLGCGEINYPGFINIDGMAWPHVHYVRSLDNLQNFKSDSVNFIFASHCLEHFSFNEIPHILSEWNRVLVKGGKLCLSVPDFDLILKIYSNENSDMRSIMPPLMGGQDYRYNFHYTNFNKKYLTELLYEASFVSVCNWEPNTDALHSIPGWASKEICIEGKSYSISLNLEATK